MATSRCAVRMSLLVVSATLLISCAAQAPFQPEPSATISWPPAPITPRIAYLFEIQRPDDVNIRSGFLRSISEALIGKEERRIVNPYGLARSGSGELYIVDSAYRGVHVLDTEKNSYSRFPDEPGELLKNPVNIAVGKGRIYVSDSVEHAVHVFDEKTKSYLRSIGRELFVRPTGIALNADRNELLVVDTKASLLYVFDTDTLKPKTVIGGNNDEISFHFPTNVAVSRTGLVFVADSLNFRIQVFDDQLNWRGEFGQPGNVPGNFSRPKGLATDSDGHVYVVDAIFDNIQVFEPDGTLLIAFGSPGSSAGQFWLPNAIHIDNEDRIYISDAYNNRVQVFQYIKAAREPELE